MTEYMLAGKIVKRQKSKIQQQGTESGTTEELSFGPTGLKYLRIIWVVQVASPPQRTVPFSETETQVCIGRTIFSEEQLGETEEGLGQNPACLWA